MGSWTAISASKEQIEKIFSKHLRFPVFCLDYSYDGDDDIGFVSFYVLRGHKVEYQFRNHKPCFVEFQMSLSDIRYDIAYPEGKMLTRLTALGLKAEKHFWAGGQI